ncbi:hypothetical protein BT67DRAFT_255413 [Trichocladium antarcticum]|uniref:Uncharacterized protein n=1 Tax=Trichocladium antarcticum TaxID=1450529 RepID=A0AAN6ZF40_9PEZI|nr:hypothetical protein BT67DRAFT_255413 [Trichocladium antarcticum]
MLCRKEKKKKENKRGRRSHLSVRPLHLILLCLCDKAGAAAFCGTVSRTWEKRRREVGGCCCCCCGTWHGGGTSDRLGGNALWSCGVILAWDGVVSCCGCLVESWTWTGGGGGGGQNMGFPPVGGIAGWCCGGPESGREANLVRCVTGWENDMFPSQFFPGCATCYGEYVDGWLGGDVWGCYLATPYNHPILVASNVLRVEPLPKEGWRRQDGCLHAGGM